jgi:hypothetical protein
MESSKESILPFSREYLECCQSALFEFSVCIQHQNTDVCRHDLSEAKRKCRVLNYPPAAYRPSPKIQPIQPVEEVLIRIKDQEEK